MSCNIYAQLSKMHYISPLTSAEFGNANPESQFLYLPTPSTADVALEDGRQFSGHFTLKR